MSGAAELRALQRRRPQKHFNHLYYNHWLEKGRFPARTPKVVRQVDVERKQSRDLVKSWNLTVNDKVLVMKGDKSIKGQIGTIGEWNERNNSVFLKESQFTKIRPAASLYKNSAFTPGLQPSPEEGLINYYPIAIQYSNLGLVLDDPTRQRFVRIATRLRSTKLRYDALRKRWKWDRILKAVRWWDTEQAKFVKYEMIPIPSPSTSSSHAGTSTQPTLPTPVTSILTRLGMVSGPTSPSTSKTSLKADASSLSDPPILFPALSEEHQSLQESSKQLAAIDKKASIDQFWKVGDSFPWPSPIAPRPIYATETETDAEVVKTSSFIPASKPWKRLIPELQIPYAEFGNPISKARRQDLWNWKNRDENFNIIKRNAWQKKELLSVQWPR